MIYYNGKDLIIIWSMSMHEIEFETKELEEVKYKLDITVYEWLDKNNYKPIGML